MHLLKYQPTQRNATQRNKPIPSGWIARNRSMSSNLYFIALPSDGMKILRQARNHNFARLVRDCSWCALAEDFRFLSSSRVCRVLFYCGNTRLLEGRVEWKCIFFPLQWDAKRCNRSTGLTEENRFRIQTRQQTGRFKVCWVIIFISSIDFRFHFLILFLYSLTVVFPNTLNFKTM